ncbi:hypothetical protein [Streptomyces fradiae]|uniref:hypothetical protein n=1 Tax=Streptomyces fradiae TaxID=1906 RepID=UPI0036FA0A89
MHGESGDNLVSILRQARGGNPPENALLDIARDGKLTTDHLRRLVAVEWQCHAVELSAYGLMSARFPRRPAVRLYGRLTELVVGAQPKLAACAEAFGMGPDDLWYRPRTYETFAFDGMLAYVAANGSQAATALALHTDVELYFGDCARLVRLAREQGVEAPDEFFRYYEGDPSTGLLDLAAEVAEDGVRNGDDPQEAILLARLLEQGIGLFWRSAAGLDVTPVHVPSRESLEGAAGIGAE